MSHSRPSVDTQTLLQSMLQRLRLQPGLETQHGRQGQAPHSPTTATQGQGEDGRRPGANVIGNGAVVLSLADDVRGAEGKGGCEKARKEFGIPAWDCNFGGSSRKGEEGRKQPTGSLPKLDRGQMVSSPSAAQGAPVLGPSSSVKRGDPGVSAGALPTVMTFTGTQTGNEGHIDPSPLGNSSLSSKTKGAQNHARSLLMTSNSDFTPRVYDWSLKSTELYPDMGSQMERWRPLGNGGSEVLGHGDVMEIMSPSQGVAENTSSTKTMKRLSENTTQRWTQRIKEKWKDRQGSFGKKRKAEDGVREGRKDAKQVKFPRQHQLSTGEDNVTKMSNKEGEMTTQSPIKESQGEAPPTLSEDSGTEGQFRSPSSFEFSLGSFSLLEEILTGQEWARFLNPSQVDTSANQTLAEEVTNQPETSQSRPQDNDSIQSTLTLDRVSQSGNVNSQWNFRPSELDQSYDRSADVSSPVNMNINEPSLDQEQNSKCELIQSAPKEYGHVQSQTSSDEVKPNHIPVLEISFIKPVEVLDSSALKSRVHLSRKRMHQSQERKEERECLKGEVGGRKQDSVPSDEGEEEREEGDNIMMPLYPLKSSLSPLPPSSPSSSSTSHPLVFRSILRHSMSQDSKCSLSMETVTKKRRMSNSHHVRFSEEVVTMPPSLLIPQDSDSEEDCETEEDSTLEEDAVMKEEVKVVPMMPQPAAALPAWIIALRRKTRKKHRH